MSVKRKPDSTVIGPAFRGSYYRKTLDPTTRRFHRPGFGNLRDGGFARRLSAFEVRNSSCVVETIVVGCRKPMPAAHTIILRAV